WSQISLSYHRSRLYTDTMALYRPVQSWMKASEAVKIIGTEHGEGFTVYIIQVSVAPYRWTTKHRYSDFKELHDKLTANFHVDKALLPPKKLFGNQSEAFVQQRQAELEHYLQTLVHQFSSVLPLSLAHFLDFPKYEVRTIVDDLAERLFREGDDILSKDSRFSTTPLVLHSLTERLKLAEPTCLSGDKRRDLAHVLDFVSQLHNLEVAGGLANVGSSNICPNALVFDLSPFKALQSLQITNCEVRGRLVGLDGVRATIRVLRVEGSLSDLGSLLLGGERLVWDTSGKAPLGPLWGCLEQAHFGHNSLEKIDLVVRLLPCVKTLNLSHNGISELENLESLPRLSDLDLSHNQIEQLGALHTKLGNIRCLHLAGNRVESLAGLSRLYSLVELDLSHNRVSLVSEVGHLGSLPCLEALDLSHNPVTQVVDYRPHALLAFGPRATELVLDHQKATQKELDTVAVLRALRVAKEGRIPRIASNAPWGDPVVAAPNSGGAKLTSPEVGVVGRAGQDGQLHEFRQQVAALRTIGGSDWLRLLNRLQHDKPHEHPTDDTPLLQTISSQEESRQDASNPETERHPTDGLPELALPDWLSSVTLRNLPFREHLQTLARGDAPEWTSWCVCLSRDGSQTVTCALKNRTSLSLLRPTSDLQRDTIPTLEVVATVAPSSMVALLVGPRHSYLELKVGSETGVESWVLLPPSAVETTELMNKFVTTLGLQAVQKYAPGEMERCATERTGGDVRFSERVLLRDGRRSTVNFAVVVPPYVAVVEDSVFYPSCPFAVRRVWDARQSVSDVRLQDDCGAGVSLDSYGHGIVLKLERDAEFAARFQSRDTRSLFLEAFLASRSACSSAPCF
ncbi:unnamed protein product, partial [Ixodes hexagonus]